MGEREADGVHLVITNVNPPRFVDVMRITAVNQIGPAQVHIRVFQDLWQRKFGSPCSDDQTSLQKLERHLCSLRVRVVVRPTKGQLCDDTGSLQVDAKIVARYRHLRHIALLEEL